MTTFGQGTRGRRALGAMLVCALLAPAAASGGVPSSGVDVATLVTNGSVRALAHAGSTTYLGGDFTRVGPRTGVGVALDHAGTLTAGFPELSGGVVRAAVADGVGGWYVGGSFTRPRARLLHVRADGSLDDGFAPVVTGGDVEALALAPDGSADAGTLYAGGTFARISARSRAGLAAIDTATGAVLDWDPAGANGTSADEVAALAARPVTLSTASRTRTVTALVVGGGFATLGGGAAVDLAVLWGAHARDGETGADTKPLPILAKGAPSGSPLRAIAVGPGKATADHTYFSVYAAGGDAPVAQRLGVETATGTATLDAAGWTAPT